MADADGRNARELFPETTDYRSIVDVSNSGDAMVFTAPTLINGQPIGASHLADLGPDGDVLATSVISLEVFNDGCADVCTNDYAFAFSPDGTRLAYVRASHQGEDPETTVVVVRDVSTGDMIELESTRASGTDGYNGAPVWSPDGRQILFTREDIRVAVQIIGSWTLRRSWSRRRQQPRQLVDTELFARDAVWSPDGSTIAFTSAIAWLGVDQRGQTRELQRGQRRLLGACRRHGGSAADEAA